VVKIITGKINSNKTTRIREYYQEHKKGDGIISKKIMIDKKVYGYKASRLSDNLEFTYLVHENFYNKGLYPDIEVFEFLGCTQIGPYRINRKAMKKINSIIDKMIKSKVSPIYFDEVGKLELQECGFYKNIKKALKKRLDIVLCTREDLIEEVLKKFDISEYEIVSR
jgi:nucleoside-triphosphatase THEP1